MSWGVLALIGFLSFVVVVFGSTLVFAFMLFVYSFFVFISIFMAFGVWVLGFFCWCSD